MAVHNDDDTVENYQRFDRLIRDNNILTVRTEKQRYNLARSINDDVKYRNSYSRLVTFKTSTIIINAARFGTRATRVSFPSGDESKNFEFSLTS